MDPNSTPHSNKRISVLGVFVRILLGFTVSIPLILVVGTVLLGAFFRLLGVSGFFEFVATNLTKYLGSIALSLFSLPLFGLLMKKRQVATPIALVTGVGILIQQPELANVSALFGMPASLLLVGEEYLSKIKQRGLAMQLLVFVSSMIAGVFIGALLLLLRNRSWM